MVISLEVFIGQKLVSISHWQFVFLHICKWLHFSRDNDAPEIEHQLLISENRESKLSLTDLLLVRSIRMLKSSA